MVSVYKHTYFGWSPAFDPKSIMHAYGHVCKRENRGVCAQGNII